jgi:hypothetical protein
MADFRKPGGPKGRWRKPRKELSSHQILDIAAAIPKVPPSVFVCTKMDKGLKLAIEKMGSSNALANALRIHRATLHHWERVPYSMLLAVEHVTGIDRSILRPEIFEGWHPLSGCSTSQNTNLTRLPGSTNNKHLRRVRLGKIKKAAPGTGPSRKSERAEPTASPALSAMPPKRK